MGPADKTQYTATYDPDGTGPIPPQALVIDGPAGLDMKKSIGFSAIPVPMIQLGIGLLFNTDLKIRYVPKYTRSGNTFQMFGLGLMHDIKQHIPGIKLLPFDLSVLVAFNSVTGHSDMKNSNAVDGPTSSDGKISYKLNSWVGQIVISKKVSVLTAYLGVGYGSVSSNADITGTFKIGSDVGPGFSIKDPLSK